MWTRLMKDSRESRFLNCLGCKKKSNFKKSLKFFSISNWGLSVTKSILLWQNLKTLNWSFRPRVSKGFQLLCLRRLINSPSSRCQLKLRCCSLTLFFKMYRIIRKDHATHLSGRGPLPLRSSRHQRFYLNLRLKRTQLILISKACRTFKWQTKTLNLLLIPNFHRIETPISLHTRTWLP